MGVKVYVSYSWEAEEDSRIVARLEEVLKAAEELTARGYATTVADARFAKPLDDVAGESDGWKVSLVTLMNEHQACQEFHKKCKLMFF